MLKRILTNRIFQFIIIFSLSQIFTGCFFDDDAPNKLKTVRITLNQINLTWTDNSFREQGFKIERKSSKENCFKEIAIVPANTKNFSDVGLSIETTYYYRVRAYYKSYNSDYSNIAIATTSIRKPLAPSNLKSDIIGQHKLLLTWSDNSDNEQGFKVERKNQYEKYEEIAVIDANIKQFRDKKLSANTTYIYRIVSFNENGSSEYSNELIVKTKESRDEIEDPSNLQATTKSFNQINLSWDDNSKKEKGFKIFRKIINEDYKEIAVVGANIKLFSDIGLKNNTTYFYQILAYNEKGRSDYSNEANATTNDIEPLAPSGLETKVEFTTITLIWKDNSDNELGFNIERSLDGVNYTKIDTVTKDITIYKDGGLEPEQLYYYRIIAYNAIGNSPFSNEVSAITQDFVPESPSNLFAGFVSENMVNLLWKDNANNEHGFSIERSTDGSSFTQIAIVGPDITMYKDINLDKSITYSYRVKAYNNTSGSSYSNIASAKYSIDIYNLNQKVQLNKDFVSMIYPSISYGELTDIYFVKLSQNLLPIGLPPVSVQVFSIDGITRSIFYNAGTGGVNVFQDSVNLQTPVSIAVTPEGIIYISDVTRQAVIKYIFDGISIKYAGLFYQNVKGIDIKLDGSSNLYILDQNTQSIIKIDGNGNPVNSFVSYGSSNKTNTITSYIFKDSNDLNNNRISGVKALALDENQNIFLIENDGKRILKINLDGYVESILYISNLSIADGISVTYTAVYLVSKIANTLMLLEPLSLKYIGKIVPNDYGEPWRKMEGMRRLAVYPATGVVVVLDANGGGMFAESAFSELYKKK